MRLFIKRILILIPVALLLNGCGLGGLASLWKLIIGVGKLGSVGAGKVLPVVGGIHATRMGVQNPSAAIIVILIIAGIVGAVYYFTKNAKDRPVTKTTTVTPKLVMPKQH